MRTFRKDFTMSDAGRVLTQLRAEVKRKNREKSDLNKKATDKNAQSNGIKSVRK